MPREHLRTTKGLQRLLRWLVLLTQVVRLTEVCAVGTTTTPSPAATSTGRFRTSSPAPQQPSGSSSGRAAASSSPPAQAQNVSSASASSQVSNDVRSGRPTHLGGSGQAGSGPQHDAATAHAAPAGSAVAVPPQSGFRSFLSRVGSALGLSGGNRPRATPSMPQTPAQQQIDRLALNRAKDVTKSLTKAASAGEFLNRERQATMEQRAVIQHAQLTGGMNDNLRIRVEARQEELRNGVSGIPRRAPSVRMAKAMNKMEDQIVMTSPDLRARLRGQPIEPAAEAQNAAQHGEPGQDQGPQQAPGNAAPPPQYLAS